MASAEWRGCCSRTVCRGNPRRRGRRFRRKLRRFGAARVLDGLAALPLDARNREQLEWLADEVLEADGEATVWIAELSSAAQERDLAARMAEAVAADYRVLIEEAATAHEQAPGQRRRTLGRLRRELRRIRARDYFPAAGAGGGAACAR